MKKNILFGFAVCGAMLMSATVAQAQETVVIEEATLLKLSALTITTLRRKTIGSSRSVPVWKFPLWNTTIPDMASITLLLLMASVSVNGLPLIWDGV